MWQTVTTYFGMTVPAVVTAAVARSLVMSVLALLILPLGLAAVAGFRLYQRELLRERPNVTLYELVETLPWTKIGGRIYSDLRYFWIIVHNYGPAGDFEVRLQEPHGYGSGGYAPLIAWENTKSESQYIGRDGEQRIKLASVATEHFGAHQRVFWWWLPQSASWSPDSHAASPMLTVGSVTADLVVHDRVSDHSHAYTFTIVAGAAGTDPTFTVEDKVREYA